MMNPVTLKGMIELRYVSLPGSFCRLLKANLQEYGNQVDLIKKFFIQDEALRAVLVLSHSDFKERYDLSQLIKSRGFINIRNRLGEAYYAYAFHGKYLQGQEIEDIFLPYEVEKSFKESIVTGYNRTYLLGFYLQLLKVEMKKEKLDTSQLDHFLIDRFYQNALRFLKSRVVKIDWVIILLYYLRSFLKEDYILQHLKNGGDFNHLLCEMSSANRETLLNNFLSYGASIDDDDFFLEDTSSFGQSREVNN